MNHSNRQAKATLQDDITVAAGIKILHGAKILPPENTGFSIRKNARLFFSDDRDGEQSIPLAPPGESDIKDIAPWLLLHQAIYLRRSDVNVLITSRLPYTHTAARAGQTVPPLLDDFAQIVGVTAKVVAGEETGPGFYNRVLKGMSRRNAVLIPDWGGVCAAGTFDDALAVAQVLEKGCRAYIDSAFLGGGFRINPVEAWLMRMVYKHKYSKMKA